MTIINLIFSLLLLSSPESSTSTDQMEQVDKQQETKTQSTQKAKSDAENIIYIRSCSAKALHSDCPAMCFMIAVWPHSVKCTQTTYVARCFEYDQNGVIVLREREECGSGGGVGGGGWPPHY